MTTGAKIALGLFGAAAVVGVAVIASKKPGRIGPPTEGSGAPSPSKDDWNTSGGIPGTEGGDGSGGGYGGKGRVLEPAPEGAPMMISKPAGSGPVGLRITDAAAMLPWVLEQAQKLGIGNVSGADGVIKKIAKVITDRKIGSVQFDQFPNLGQINWKQILGYLKGVPWGTIGPLAQAWLKAKGIA